MYVSRGNNSPRTILQRSLTDRNSNPKRQRANSDSRYGTHHRSNVRPNPALNARHVLHVLRAPTAGAAGKAAFRERQGADTRLRARRRLRSIRLASDDRARERQGTGRAGHLDCGAGGHVWQDRAAQRPGEQAQHPHRRRCHRCGLSRTGQGAAVQPWDSGL